MKKWIPILLFLSLVLFGCSQNDSEKVTETNQGKEVKVENGEVAEDNSSNNEENETPKDESTEKLDSDSLKVYRPEVGITKHFYEGEQFLFSEKIVAANQDYIQRVITIGNSTPTVQVLKWTDNEISVVYESNDGSNVEKNILEDFSNGPTLETFINKSLLEKSDWNISSKEEVVKTPIDSFQNVIVVSKQSNEVEGETTLHTYFFAPGMGLVKEVYEVTGELGYISESLLTEVK